MPEQVLDLANGFVAPHRRHEVTLLPDPPRAQRFHTIISADDHLVEPPDTFEGRLPARLQDRAPRVVPLDSGGEAWLFEGNLLPNIGLAAASGRPAREWGTDPERFEDMRRGTWDPLARVHDMDLDGIYASLNFPSFLPGFGGNRLQTLTDDVELALACVRAYNSWHLEEWVGAAPDRFIPCQIPWLLDPEVGAQEIRANAERGFKAVTFPERPEGAGMPSVFTDHWDPIMRACEETGTVLCLHTGSGGLPDFGPGAPASLAPLVFGSYALIPTACWLYSMIPVRFPGLKICMSEGGIGWVAALLDRLEHLRRHEENEAYYAPWHTTDLKPAEVLRRNFWFCAVDDEQAWRVRDAIGVDRILIEVDYPHPDASWPNSQAQFARQLRDVPKQEAERITWRNASELFRHPVPPEVQRDPDAF